MVGRIATTRRVVFVTMDDGWTRAPDLVAEVAQRRVPLTVFLLGAAARGHVAYFRALQRAGARIEDHTMTHPVLPRLSYAAQKSQICRMADEITRDYGRQPALFRPPYGSYDSRTVTAAAACGIRTVVLWSVRATPAGSLVYQVGHRLRPGDIILMHFLPGDARSLTRVLATIRRQGFQVGRLEDYLPGNSVQPR